MSEAPSVDNYYIGKGVISFKPVGGEWRDVGNAPEFEWTPELEKLDHFSSRTGVRVKDKTVVIEKRATVRLVLDEWDIENLALAFLGDISENTEGQKVIDIFSRNAVRGELKFVGQNEIGPKIEMHLLAVDFIPGAAINPISEEWGVIELSGECAAVNGKFGTVTELTTTPETESDPETA